MSEKKPKENKKKKEKTDDTVLEVKVKNYISALYSEDDFFIGEPLPEMPTEKIDYAQNKCKKKKYNKEYFICKEPIEKVIKCANAIYTGQKHYCPKPPKKEYMQKCVLGGKRKND